MKEVKLSCSKCHFRLFTTVANDEAGHFPAPFDITPFSFTPTMTSRTHKRDWIPFPFAHLPQYTLFAPQTFMIRIVFSFSWKDYNTQEKLKTKLMQNLGDKQGVLHKRYAKGKCRSPKAASIFTLLLNRRPHSYCW